MTVSVFASGLKSEFYEDFELYGGVGAEMLYAEGFKNTRISDVKNYPSNEGSLYLPLSDMNGTDIPILLTLGGKRSLLDNLDLTVSGSFGYIKGASRTIHLDAGLSFYFFTFDDLSLSIGIGAKAGGFEFTKNLGKAQILPGTTPPVILEKGTIRNGDQISYTAMGVSGTPLAAAKLQITDNFGIIFNAGYQFAYSFKTALQAKNGNNTPISIDPQQNDCYYEPLADQFVELQMDPKVTLNGFTGGIYFSYKF